MKDRVSVKYIHGPKERNVGMMAMLLLTHFRPNGPQDLVRADIDYKFIIFSVRSHLSSERVHNFVHQIHPNSFLYRVAPPLRRMLYTHCRGIYIMVEN